MPAAPSNNTLYPAVGRVENAFDITDKGTVVCVDDLEGTVLIGDTAFLGETTAQMTGIEMISARNPDVARCSSIDLLLADVDKSTVLPHIGQLITFHRDEVA